MYVSTVRLMILSKTQKLLLAGSIAIALSAVTAFVIWFSRPCCVAAYSYVQTAAGTEGEFGEPFGVAVRDGYVYISDGQNGSIWRLNGEASSIYANGLHTPSAIVFDDSGDLLVADPGQHTIRRVRASGEVETIAGVDGRTGNTDGETSIATFNAPVGIVAVGQRIFVADTYNDRIRVIENGIVSTLAGGKRGYADGTSAMFDTPCGLAVWGDKLIVADSGNRRIRVVESDGRVWTLAGSGAVDLKDGLPMAASFVQPTAVTVDSNGIIYVADGNAIRQIGGHTFSTVTTISDERRGLRDGRSARSRFNRPSGLAIDNEGSLLVADSENRLIRKVSSLPKGRGITTEQISAMLETPETFRSAQPPRWPFDPPDVKRDIAGTLGEVRGEIMPDSNQVWFHNGLDVAGAYGETARFVRDEKVLKVAGAENFGTLRELLRMPTIGYIHIRLGRSADGKRFEDPRFQFTTDKTGRATDVRIPRGSAFKAGEPIGTLNSMNHVHLIAGRSGSEMNALDALALPSLTDTRPPVIENVRLFDGSWQALTSETSTGPIKVNMKTRIVVKAYDQVDGNSERRRLGVYRLGYQLMRTDGTAREPPIWTITFDRLPETDAVPFVYANGSRSGATGETIFNYIVTNRVSGDSYREDFLDIAGLTSGPYILRAFAADYFGNMTSKDVEIEIP